MQTQLQTADSKRYARAVEVSKRVRFEIERDVIRGRKFDFGKKSCPTDCPRSAGSTSLARTRSGL